MILSRSPLRITLGGGGTDLPSYYLEHGGIAISAAIDKYVYVCLQRTFLDRMSIRYSQIETVKNRSEIHHPIIREALEFFNIWDDRIEITTLADIPAGTGLGSSGSFTTALLKALFKYKRQFVLPNRLAELACFIEIDKLKEPVGKQDQNAAAFGGLLVMEFTKDGQTNVRPLDISNSTQRYLEDNLLLFSTGIRRSASSILKDQNDRSKQGDQEMTSNLHFIREIGFQSCKALEAGDVITFGKLMDEHWRHKRARSSNISSGEIDQWYATAMENGAVGGKLIGAGGGGFLMFYTEDPSRLRAVMEKAGLEELRFSFDYEGTKIL